MLLLLFAQTQAQQAAVVTGGNEKKKRVQLAPIYSPTPAPEYWESRERQRRRNRALLLSAILR